MSIRDSQLFSSGSGFPAVRLECWKQETKSQRSVSTRTLSIIALLVWLTCLVVLTVVLTGCGPTKAKLLRAEGCGRVLLDLDGTKMEVSSCVDERGCGDASISIDGVASASGGIGPGECDTGIDAVEVAKDVRKK